ncbi:hypothetical protein [Paenibacillus taihuensis]|nr:hypothetical protein [Paenibacillus taihuensis]
MKSRKRAFLMGFGLFAVLLVAGLLPGYGGRFTAHAPEKQPVPESVPVTSNEAATAAKMTESLAVPEEAPLTHSFQTDSAEKQVLWQDGKQAIFVQNGQLINTAGTESAAEQTIYTWPAPSSSQAWLNGEYALIGTQLIASKDGNRGSWLLIRIADQPAILGEQKMFFGPDDVLAMGSAKEPRLFFAQCRNAESISEYVLDPSRKQWERVEGGDFLAGAVKRTGAVPYQLDAPKVIQLTDQSTVDVFTEASGSIVYYTMPYFMVRRYDGFEVLDAKLIPYLDGQPPQILGRLKDQSGHAWLSFLNSDPMPILLQPDDRLWEGEWRALDGKTFTRASANRLEVLQYGQGDDAKAGIPSSYRQFATAGAKLVSAAQSLLTYEKDDGKKRLLDWRDVVYSAGAPQEQVWASPLQESMDFIVKQEPRPSWDTAIKSHKVVAPKAEELNTNASVPDDLLAALDQVNREGDYAAAKTFRKFGSDWYVLVDRQLYAYQDGQMNLLGEMPVTVVHEIGEGVSGHGARDFIRLEEGWIVADTEGSRVVKLDDRLQVMAELEVPQPYMLDLRENRLQIASYAKTVVTDPTLKKSRSVTQSFQSAAKGDQAAHDFWPDEWYRDLKRGLTWYYLDGFLYQFEERSGRYRAFYLGVNINARAHVHIIPYNGEVNVLLDHRLERFDRGGKWLGTLPFPRGNPDSIYDRTPQGENSLVMDEASDSLYLVQGYRILRIDLKEQTLQMVFGQNDADIGKLMPYKGRLYAVLHSNQADIDRHLQEGDAATTSMNTEIVEIDPAKKSVHRYIVEGYYDAIRVGRGSESAVHMDLIQYTASN